MEFFFLRQLLNKLAWASRIIYDKTIGFRNSQIDYSSTKHVIKHLLSKQPNLVFSRDKQFDHIILKENVFAEFTIYNEMKKKLWDNFWSPSKSLNSQRISAFLHKKKSRLIITTVCIWVLTWHGPKKKIHLKTDQRWYSCWAITLVMLRDA